MQSRHIGSLYAHKIPQLHGYSARQCILTEATLCRSVTCITWTSLSCLETGQVISCTFKHEPHVPIFECVDESYLLNVFGAGPVNSLGHWPQYMAAKILMGDSEHQSYSQRKCFLFFFFPFSCFTIRDCYSKRLSSFLRGCDKERDCPHDLI